MANVLITNACRYAGPDAVAALSGDAHSVLCHDMSFGEAHVRASFKEQYATAHPLTNTLPEKAVSEAFEQSDIIDVLFCNHFQSPEAKPFDETNDDDFRQTLETLLVEPYRFIRSALPSLRASEDARIIVMTSAAPLRPGANVSLYTAARAGANSLVESLARELGPDGIAVFGIAPNYYASDDTYSNAAFEKSDRFRASVQRNVPLQRLSNENEMPGLIRYLAYDDSAFLTGQVIAFTGGWA